MILSVIVYQLLHYVSSINYSFRDSLEHIFTYQSPLGELFYTYQKIMKFFSYFDKFQTKVNNNMASQHMAAAPVLVYKQSNHDVIV